LAGRGLVRLWEAASGGQPGKGSHVPLSCLSIPACPQQTWRSAGLAFCQFNELNEIAGASVGERGREG